MKQTDYSPEFEQLWSAFTGEFGKKGSKKNAAKVFKSLKVEANDLEMLLNSVKIQHEEKRNSIAWMENFQHVERWLKNERWTDEKCEPIAQQTIAKSDQRKSEALARYRAKHTVADNLEPVTSSKGNVRGTGQLNLGILESEP